MVRQVKKFSVGVNHYWSKTVGGNYGGEWQQLVIELLIVAILLPITIYAYVTPGLGLFFAGFLIPVIIFTLGALLTSYYMFVEWLKRRKSEGEPTEN